MEGDRGPYGIKWPPPVLRKHKTLQPTNLRTHLAMDPGKKREIVEGKKHVVEEELSSAAENGTPQNKLMRDAMKGGNQERSLQMYKTRITAAALSEALKEAAMGDEDAIAINFDEIWQLRGGMVEKDLDGHKFLIKFEQKGDFNHVLKGGPWLYQDYPMLVTKYDGKSSLADFPVNSMAVWVRVMDIPPGMMTEKWARKMGDQLGTYKEIAKESKNQIGDVSGTDGVSQERVEIDAALEDTEEDRTETTNPEDVLQMVAAVENLKMQEGKGIINNQIVTDEQVSNAAVIGALKAQMQDKSAISGLIREMKDLLSFLPGFVVAKLRRVWLV
ncbi:hypothetical protein ACQ4PT_052165 [Festuca glaucescens]